MPVNSESFVNRVYYALKPVLPGSLRLGLRRLRAKRIRKECANIWPVYEPSGRAPEGWPGWPDAKQFAFVLSHDVEGQQGVDRCRAVAELEMEYGFRSSFNFIPQGDYKVPTELLQWLRSNGFEVGVHDFRHDGTLFQSNSGFQRAAKKINHQLRDWGAVGFRAGFMLHKLDWLHALDIEYDASTFDVDPFEPQPDGVQTIFPFWVPRPDPNADAYNPRSNGATSGGETRGFVELPYTLVQDYNLFVVLKERGIDIWRKKLAWLADKGGMALLDTHPDYMAMSGRPGKYEFPVQHYRDFLAHVRTTYGDRYWHALPREVAAYCRPIKLRQARPPRQVAMLTHSFYDYDNRVRRYAETLAARGDEVRVFCLGTPEQVKSGQWDQVGDVHVLRLQSREVLESDKWKHAQRLLKFLWRAFAALNDRNLPHGCELFHVHNIPDFLVFAGWKLKLRGARLILDIHDIVPELYQSKFRDGRGSITAAGLRHVEALSCGFSDHVIVANHIWKDTVIERSAPPEKVTALVNNVDLQLFERRARTRPDDRLVLVYPGTLNHHQGLDLAIEAVHQLAPELPKIELHIYGNGPTLRELKEQAARLGLQERVLFHATVPLNQVANVIANADVGIVPKRAVGFGDQAYSTKIMEFMSQCVPVVLSRTRVDTYYFDDSVVSFFESGNPADLATKIRRLALDKPYRDALAARGFAYATANSWATKRHIYLDLVDRLTTTSWNYRESSESTRLLQPLQSLRSRVGVTLANEP